MGFTRLGWLKGYLPIVSVNQGLGKGGPGQFQHVLALVMSARQIVMDVLVTCNMYNTYVTYFIMKNKFGNKVLFCSSAHI